MDRGSHAARRFDEPLKQQAAGWTGLDAALRVPLQPKDEVARVGAFDGFDDGILRATSGHAQSIAHNSDRLVMAGVDREPQKVRSMLHFRTIADNLRELGTWLDQHRMCHSYASPGAMIDRYLHQILHQGPGAPAIQGLCSVTNCQ